DNEGALAAMNEAVRWAPYYAKPRWQRGNLLLRMGRYDEAFADLRYASSRNKKLLPSLIDLAWGFTADARATETLLQISNDNNRLAFARFLAAKGKGVEVHNQVRLLNAPLSAENKEELVRLLAAAQQYKDAFELWKGSETREGVVNGGFEEPLSNNSYFRWNVYEGPANSKFAIDVSEKFGGAKSLQISLDGAWDPGTPLLSQTIVVHPGQRYRLNFAVKTKDLVTGGPPRIVLTDATSNQVIAKSDAFPRSTDSWQQMHIEFTGTPNTGAVSIRLARDDCQPAPCPIFGLLWLDEFSLEKL
ncbi:MAG TPA: carbohydrate binding domain-containing protein, partial [Pyrinomonadaceae bacterium]|nr:carbohydrate binding domain-containing protein [Pyrinomonadaceae bacterium]